MVVRGRELTLLLLGWMGLAFGASQAATQDDHLPAALTRDTAAALTTAPTITTGHQAVDMLLRRDIVGKEPPQLPSAPSRVATTASAGATVSGALAGLPGARPEAQSATLRDALLREGADFATAHARQSAAAEAMQMRAEANLDGGPLPPAAATLAAPQQAAEGDSWLSGLRGIPSWLREHRYAVGGVALALGLLGGITSAWRAYRRMVLARDHARRRRRDSRPAAMRADTHAQARAATRTVPR